MQRSLDGSCSGRYFKFARAAILLFSYLAECIRSLKDAGSFTVGIADEKCRIHSAVQNSEAEAVIIDDRVHVAATLNDKGQVRACSRRR